MQEAKANLRQTLKKKQQNLGHVLPKHSELPLSSSLQDIPRLRKLRLAENRISQMSQTKKQDKLKCAKGGIEDPDII